ncbi:MAG: tetratricopeptide repeat protein [Clostridium sp.]|nr:tetratricopeptide repeat protein [Clostridium sp.]
MKSKFLFTLLVGCGLTAAAQGGYQDGVDNFNAGRLDVAKVILDNTINDPSTDKAVSYFYLGSIDMAENNVAAAKANFERGLQANPANAYNMIGLGEVALKNGDKATAEKYFKDALATDKKNTALSAAVARAYYNVDPTLYAKEIDKNIAKALKDSKNSESAVYILLGDMKAAEDPGDAAGQYEMAISQDESKGVVNREAYVKYANTYFRVNPKFAISKLEELNQKEPNSALAQRELAEKYYDNNQFGSALQQYRKYLTNPNHFQKDEQRLAGLLYSADENDESIKLARQILAKDPDNEYMYRVLLLNYAKLKDYPQAVEAGQKLFAVPGVKPIPNDYIAYGDALTGLKLDSAAVEVFEKAVELNPDKSELLLRLSTAYDKAGMPDRGVETMKKYLALGQASTNDIYNMARRLQSLARTLPEGTPERRAVSEEALGYINQVIEKVPDNPQVYNTKGGIIISEFGITPEAVETYTKMIELFEADPANVQKNANALGIGYYVLGSNALQNGDDDQAKAYYEKYADLVANPEPSILKFLGRE